MKQNSNASQQAALWASKKKEMMEKAVRTREDRKTNLQANGELALGQKPSHNEFNMMQQPEYDKPRSSNSQQKYQQQQYDSGANYRKPQQQYNEYDDANYARQYDQIKNQQRQYSNGKQQPQSQIQAPSYNNQPQAYNKAPATYSKTQSTIQTYNKPPSQEGRRQPQQYVQSQVQPQKPPVAAKTMPKQQQYGGGYNQQQAQQSQPQYNEPPKQARRQQQQQYYNPIDDLPVGKAIEPSHVPSQSEPLFECNQGCGRSFTRVALQKHQPVCVKVFQKKRKEFNTQKQRIISNEQLNHLRNQKVTEKKYEKAANKKKQWKQQSEAFRAVLKLGKGGQISAQQQNALQQANDANFIQCPHCGRKFNDSAAARHIPYCATKSKQVPRQPAQQSRRR